MDAGIIFYQAHRTAVCQMAAEAGLAKLDIAQTAVHACTNEAGLRRCLADYLKTVTVLVFLSRAEEEQLCCAAPIFTALRIPLDENGEPRHVRRLEGENHHGYLIESRSQAILLLPDIPEELEYMLPSAMERLARKFSKTLPPEKETPDFEALVEFSFSNHEELF